MGFGEAFINVLLLNQKIINSPFIYDTKVDRLIGNPNFKKKRKFCNIWYIGNTFITSVWLFCLIHLGVLIKRYDPINAGKEFKEEVLVYVFASAICTEAVICWEAVQRNPAWFANVEGQVLIADNVRYQGFPNAQRPLPLGIQEASIYILAAGFFFFPTVGIALPLIRSFDPINQMFLLFVPFHVHSYIRKVIVVILYVLSVSFGAMSCLNLIMAVIYHLYTVAKLCRRNFQISVDFLNHSPSIRYDKMGQLTCNVSKFSRLELRNLRNVFIKRRNFYIQMKLITADINENLNYWVPYTLTAGIALCVISNFGAIEFHSRLPPIMIAGLIFVLVSMLLLQICCFTVAAHPMLYSGLFKKFWGKVKIGGLQRKMVNALPPVYYGMGNFFSIKPTTVLDILQTILDYTINALMT